MNFYKYQNKLISICEKITFKCTECYQSFLTQADLQCHVYEHHHQVLRDSSSAPESKEGVKQEKVTAVACGEPLNGDVTTNNDGGDAEKPIKMENQEKQVNVKTEKLEKDEHDDDDEELIDVGVNNRTETKSRAENDAAH